MSRAGHILVVVTTGAVAAVSSVQSVSAEPLAEPRWTKCPGTLAVGGRTFVLAINGGVTCAFGRKSVPPLQLKIANRVATPGRIVYFAGPPGWKCLAVAEPPARKREMWGYCALGISSFKDPKAKAVFTWMTPRIAKQRLG